MHINTQYRIASEANDESPVLKPPAELFPGLATLPAWGSRALACTGVYAHKLSSNMPDLLKQLDKITANALPVPATLIGIGVHGTYNAWQWKGTHGVLFKHTAPILIGHKRDFFSNRLKPLATQTYQDHLSALNDAEKAALAYSAYLTTHLNSIQETTRSAYDNTYRKQLHLVQDAKFAHLKCREMEIRAGVDLEWGEFKTGAEDQCSKSVILSLLKERGLDSKLANMSKKELIDTMASDDQPMRRSQLAHAQVKIGRLGRSAFANYKERILTNATHSANRYSSYFANRGALYPNELLLLPGIEDIQGLLIEPLSPQALDEALDLKGRLFSTWTDHTKRALKSPAYVHLISDKSGRSLIAVDWTEDIEPWTSKQLVCFAQYGQITLSNGQKTVPDLKGILLKLSIAAFLPLNGSITEGRYQHRRDTFLENVDDLCVDTKSLLHLCIDRKAEEEIFRVLMVVGCDPERTWGQHGSALEYAEKKYPAVVPILNEFIQNKAGKSQSDAVAKQCQKFLGIRSTQSFDMRQGYTEAGTADFLPELIAHRVVVGHKKHPNLQQKGYFAFDDNHGDTNLWFGRFETQRSDGIRLQLSTNNSGAAMEMARILASRKGNLSNWEMNLPIVLGDDLHTLRFKFFPYRRNNDHTVCDIEWLEDPREPEAKLISSLICKKSVALLNNELPDLTLKPEENASQWLQKTMLVVDASPWVKMLLRLGIALSPIQRGKADTKYSDFYWGEHSPEIVNFRKAWETEVSSELLRIKVDLGAAKADMIGYLNKIDLARRQSILIELKRFIPKVQESLPRNLANCLNNWI